MSESAPSRAYGSNGCVGIRLQSPSSSENGPFQESHDQTGTPLAGLGTPWPWPGVSWSMPIISCGSHGTPSQSTSLQPCHGSSHFPGGA